MRAITMTAAAFSLGVALNAYATNYTFNGADSSGSGKLDESNHWSPVGMPTESEWVFFDKTGDVSTDSDVTFGGLQVRSANALLNFSFGDHAVSIDGMRVGSGSANTNNTLNITNGTLTLRSDGYVGFSGGNETLRVGEGGRLSAPNKTLYLSNATTSRSNTFYVAKNGSANLNLLSVGYNGSHDRAEINGATNVNITTVQIGAGAAGDDCEMVIRDSENVTIGSIYVGVHGERAHLLVTNVANFSCNEIQVSGQYVDPYDASAELYLESTCLPKIKMLGPRGRVMYDAGGAVQSGSFLSTFAFGASGSQRLELRNYSYTCTECLRIRNVCSYLDLVIGKGSTLSSTFATYSPLYMDSNPGARLAVDGGTLDLTTAASAVALNYCSDGNNVDGSGNLIEVLNGGTFNLDGKNIYWGLADTGGVTKTSCNTIRVANGGSLVFNELRLWNSSQKIVVSNATVSAGTVYMPYANAGWATNNVVRFEGSEPSFSLTGPFYVYQSVDEATQRQQSETILEFVLPETMYAQPPLLADSFNLYGDVRLRIDTSRYADHRKWMTIMRADTGTINISQGNTWDNFISEVPGNCEVRRTPDNKELQIRVRGKNRFGMMMVFR